MNYVDILKALADSNRLAIMCYLQGGEKCVCEIEQVLAVSQSATSKHLNKLRLVGLIEAKKVAQWVHYSIPDRIYSEYPFLRQLLSEASPHYAFDTSNLPKMKC